MSIASNIVESLIHQYFPGFQQPLTDLAGSVFILPLYHFALEIYTLPITRTVYDVNGCIQYSYEEVLDVLGGGDYDEFVKRWNAIMSSLKGSNITCIFTQRLEGGLGFRDAELPDSSADSFSHACRTLEQSYNKSKKYLCPSESCIDFVATNRDTRHADGNKVLTREGKNSMYEEKVNKPMTHQEPKGGSKKSKAYVGENPCLAGSKHFKNAHRPWHQHLIFLGHHVYAWIDKHIYSDEFDFQLFSTQDDYLQSDVYEEFLEEDKRQFLIVRVNQHMFQEKYFKHPRPFTGFIDFESLLWKNTYYKFDPLYRWKTRWYDPQQKLAYEGPLESIWDLRMYGHATYELLLKAIVDPFAFKAVTEVVQHAENMDVVHSFLKNYPESKKRLLTILRNKHGAEQDGDSGDVVKVLSTKRLTGLKRLDLFGGDTLDSINLAKRSRLDDSCQLPMTPESKRSFKLPEPVMSPASTRCLDGLGCVSIASPTTLPAQAKKDQDSRDAHQSHFKYPMNTPKHVPRSALPTVNKTTHRAVSISRVADAQRGSRGPSAGDDLRNAGLPVDSDGNHEIGVSISERRRVNERGAKMRCLGRIDKFDKISATVHSFANPTPMVGKSINSKSWLRAVTDNTRPRRLSETSIFSVFDARVSEDETYGESVKVSVNKSRKRDLEKLCMELEEECSGIGSGLKRHKTSPGLVEPSEDKVSKRSVLDPILPDLEEFAAKVDAQYKAVFLDKKSPANPTKSAGAFMEPSTESADSEPSKLNPITSTSSYKKVPTLRRRNVPACPDDTSDSEDCSLGLAKKRSFSQPQGPTKRPKNDMSRKTDLAALCKSLESENSDLIKFTSGSEADCNRNKAPADDITAHEPIMLTAAVSSQYSFQVVEPPSKYSNPPRISKRIPRAPARGGACVRGRIRPSGPRRDDNDALPDSRYDLSHLKMMQKLKASNTLRQILQSGRALLPLVLDDDSRPSAWTPSIPLLRILWSTTVRKTQKIEFVVRAHVKRNILEPPPIYGDEIPKRVHFKKFVTRTDIDEYTADLQKLLTQTSAMKKIWLCDVLFKELPFKLDMCDVSNLLKSNTKKPLLLLACIYWYIIKKVEWKEALFKQGEGAESPELLEFVLEAVILSQNRRIKKPSLVKYSDSAPKRNMTALATKDGRRHASLSLTTNIDERGDFLLHSVSEIRLILKTLIEINILVGTDRDTLAYSESSCPKCFDNDESDMWNGTILRTLLVKRPGELTTDDLMNFDFKQFLNELAFVRHCQPVQQLELAMEHESLVVNDPGPSWLQ